MKATRPFGPTSTLVGDYLSSCANNITRFSRRRFPKEASQVETGFSAAVNNIKVDMGCVCFHKLE